MEDEARIGFQHLPGHVRRRLEQALEDVEGNQEAGVSEARAEVPRQPAPRDASDEMPQARTSFRDLVRDYARTVLQAALEETRGNVSEAARRLGMSRQNLQYWLREVAVDPARYRR